MFNLFLPLPLIFSTLRPSLLTTKIRVEKLLMNSTSNSIGKAGASGRLDMIFLKVRAPRST